MHSFHAMRLSLQFYITISVPVWKVGHIRLGHSPREIYSVFSVVCYLSINMGHRQRPHCSDKYKSDTNENKKKDKDNENDNDDFN